MNTKGKMLLTSIGLSSKDVLDTFLQIKDTNNLSKAVIITTASEDKEQNEYAQLALSQLKSTGLEKVDFYDFEDDDYKDLSSYDIIYVCGGNTFKLMKFARKLKFDDKIKSLLDRGGLYIGVSAGSLIVGPSIKIANEVSADDNDVRLTDFSGFNITDTIIFPHYSTDLEDEISEFEKKYGVMISRITNTQFIVI